MTNLAGLPPLGLKDRDAPRQPKKRKPVRKVSRKQQAKRRTPEYVASLEHMRRVRELPCMICGAMPAEFHHEGKPRCHSRGLPLCPRHHRREFGPGAYHYSPKAFYEAHGDSKFLLAVVADQLAGQFNDPWGKR